MKSHIKNLFLLPTLIAGIGLIPAGRVTAQTFTTLHSFTATSGSYPYPYTNSEGANPEAGLILSANTLYGTAYGGGSSGYGTVFKVNTDGTGFTVLHNFTGGSDGAGPVGELILSDNTLYGTAYRGGGLPGYGTVFKVNTNGSDFTYLTGNSDRNHPHAGLILSANTLYGTAFDGGGIPGYGTVFKGNTNFTGFTKVHRFTATSGPYPSTNSDGANPIAGLILSASTLYGTAFGGGSSGNGTVFKVNTNGSGFTNLHSFTAIYPDPVTGGTNSDGAKPSAGLVLSGNTLYGTAHVGGNSAGGTVFKVNTDGTGFTNLHSFTADSVGTKSDGAYPDDGLLLSGNTLYGTTRFHGVRFGQGTVFAVNTDGTGFTNLYTFTASSTNSSGVYTNGDGASPSAVLILSGNTLYGTAVWGGSSGNGTVFSLSFAPQLTIIPSGANVILSWPSNVAGFDYSGFTLQSTTNLVSPAVWSTSLPSPVVVNGQNTVTNPISDARKFYRLSQ